MLTCRMLTAKSAEKVREIEQEWLSLEGESYPFLKAIFKGVPILF